MDIAYPVGHRRRNPDQLLWSIRSMERHFPLDRIFIAGKELPKGLDPDCDRLVFLPTAQDQSKFWNIGENLDAVLASDISEDFMWMNDDFFIYTDQDESMPLYARTYSMELFCWRLTKKAKERPVSPEFRAYVDGLVGQKRILTEWGFNPRHNINVDTHTPLNVNKADLIEVIARVKEEYPRHPYGMFRSLYGAGRDPVAITDPKIMNVVKLPPRDWWMVSTNDKSWVQGKVGKWLREMFDSPSPFERSYRDE